MKTVKSVLDNVTAKVVAEFTTGQLSRSTKLGLAAAAVGYVTMFGAGTAAMAATGGLNDVLGTGVARTQKIPDLITYGAYIIGTGFSVMGLLGVKKHVDDAGQNKLGPALGKLGIGGLLFAVPYIANTATNTFGATDQNVTLDGIGAGLKI